LDRYAAFTDLKALKEASILPLRKSLRVNTLKISVETFQRWAKEHRWNIAPVPWCTEGFFIDREDRSTALGKDLLHLLGHVYIQEAASMLPVALLDPQPGECVLDMAAAPGSKTTQIAARMCNRGAIVANDVQPARLATLRGALERSGAVNTVVMRKDGQWYGARMCGRFQRVLCDVPCTAQGTARKDSSALQYSSQHSIAKMAALQKRILTAGIHAAAVGGRIVYSTCTLTQEENEEVIAWILNKFNDQVSALNPAECIPKVWDSSAAVDASARVQEGISMPQAFPAARLWPHTEDTEGFFCAVLQKHAPTCEREPRLEPRMRARPIKHSQQQAVSQYVRQRYGTDFLCEGEQLYQDGSHILLGTRALAECGLPTGEYALGLPYARGTADKRYRLSNELATARGHMASKSVCILRDAQMTDVLGGNNTSCDPALQGDVILQWNGVPIGVALAQGGKLKNKLSRWLVQQSAEESIKKARGIEGIRATMVHPDHGSC